MAAERKRGLTQQEIDKMRAEKTAELMKQVILINPTEKMLQLVVGRKLGNIADLRSRKAEVTVKISLAHVGPGTFLKFNLHETESAKDLDEIRIEKLINKAYKRRYFRLINGQLRYFALKSSPMNKIKGLALHTFEKNVGEEYGFRIVHSERSFTLKAESKEDFEMWQNALKNMLPTSC
eukprot:jgi/Bigna1/146873/aug1.123_g21581